MAINQIFAPSKSFERAVPSDTVAGTPLLINSRPAVTITARGDATDSVTVGGVTVEYPVGGVGNADDSASVVFDGTFEFAVTGALTNTGQDVAVYITGGGALTLTEGANTLFGYTNYPVDYRKEAGRACVRIGA